VFEDTVCNNNCGEDICGFCSSRSVKSSTISSESRGLPVDLPLFRLPVLTNLLITSIQGVSKRLGINFGVNSL
jgi:hypothetical protein